MRTPALSLACLAGLAAILLPAMPRAAGERDDQLSTPRRALEHFINSGREGDYDRAARALDLSGLPEQQRAAEGARLARRLKLVLDQKLWIEWERVSDEPAGDPTDGPDVDVIGAVPVSGKPVPVSLARIEAEGGERVWKISAASVARIPELYEAYGAGWIGDHLPELLFRFRVLEIEVWQWIGLLLALGAAWLLGIGLAWAGLWLADRLARKTAVTWDERLVDIARGPARFFLGVLAFGGLADLLRLAAPAQSFIDKCCRALLVVAAAWALLRFVSFLAVTLQDVLTQGESEGRARGVHTMVAVLRRVASVIVSVVAAALVLTQFEVVRNLGMSLLASAGIAGIVVGLAAQKSISSLLAGIQLSIAQPIRIGDSVVVEGEFGTIEEIHLTYVVVRVWDLRRLIVPITRFLEAPFQNWTKVSPELLGTVEIFADYSVPIDQVRAELLRFCEDHPAWDKKVCSLQLTAVSERSVTLRALVSSADAGKNSELRHAVREQLVNFLQQLDGGRYLPQVRVTPADEGAGASKSESIRNVASAG
ncbi:MAG: mechanosensitive ion channel family protein [Myxococcales bacterium]